MHDILAIYICAMQQTSNHGFCSIIGSEERFVGISEAESSTEKDHSYP
jgi:hypothetical protein